VQKDFNETESEVRLSAIDRSIVESQKSYDRRDSSIIMQKNCETSKKLTWARQSVRISDVLKNFKKNAPGSISRYELGSFPAVTEGCVIADHSDPVSNYLRAVSRSADVLSDARVPEGPLTDIFFGCQGWGQRWGALDVGQLLWNFTMGLLRSR
jgi:hypothetical protein